MRHTQLWGVRRYPNHGLAKAYQCQCQCQCPVGLVRLTSSIPTASLTLDRVSRLPDLIAMARESSSDRRRKLLRELSEVFFGSPTHSEAEDELYSEVFTGLLTDMETAVRAELSHRFSTRLNAPRSLIRRFALDEIEVAAPVLQVSQVLTDEDLLDVVRTQGQAHLRAVSRRAGVSEVVSDVVVARSDDETLHTLLGNEGASLSRQASENAVDRARVNPALHAVVVERRTLPHDLLNEMYFAVESELRRRIVARNASLDPELLDSAIATALSRLGTEDGILPRDYLDAMAQVKAARAGRTLTSIEIARILRSGNQTAFRIALSEVSAVDFYTVSRIMEQGEIDGLAVLCRAANLDGPLFLTIALSVLGNSASAMGRARAYSLHYAELGQEAASRTLRFWRMRRAG